VREGAGQVSGLCAVDLIQINATYSFSCKQVGRSASRLLSLMQAFNRLRRKVSGDLVVRTVAALGIKGSQTRKVNRFGDRIFLAGTLKEQFCLLQEFGERWLRMRLVQQVRRLTRCLFKLICRILGNRSVPRLVLLKMQEPVPGALEIRC
jgi:hypothetical protein